MMIKNTFVLSDEKVIKDLQSQRLEKTLYISNKQAAHYNINRAQFKYVYIDKDLVKIKYIKHENLIKMKDKVFIKEYEY